MGVFLLPVAPFLLAGVVRLLRRRSVTDLALLAGFLAAPLPIVISLPSTPDYSIARALLLIPFGVLIAAHGVDALLTCPKRWVRAAAAALLLAMPLQFAGFATDYFTDYRGRSASRFDQLNTREVAAQVLALDAVEPVPAIVLSGNLENRAIRWKFYMLKARRSDLWERTTHFDMVRAESPAVAPGTLLVFSATDPAVATLLHLAIYSTAATISGVDGGPGAVLLRRDQ